MCKLQLLNKNYNLLTKFNIEKSSSIHLANFLTWYEFETYTKNAPLKEFSPRQNSPYGSYHHHPQGKREITHPTRQSFYYKKIWRDFCLDFKILFLNLVFCLSDPLDRHNQASGYSICYNGSGFLNSMANSSGQKMNLKCPCSSFPIPMLTKLVPSRFCKYCDFTKIVKFFIKSLEVPKQKQA